MSSCNFNLDALRSLSEMDEFTDRPLPEACCKSTFDAEWSTQVDLDLTKTYLCSQGKKLAGQNGVLFNQFVNGSVEMIWAKCQELKRLGYTGKGICNIAVTLIKELKDESKIFLANAQLYDENKGEVTKALNSLSRKIDTLFLQKVVLITRPELEQIKTKPKSLKELMGVTAQSTYEQHKAIQEKAMKETNTPSGVDSFIP